MLSHHQTSKIKTECTHTAGMYNGVMYNNIMYNKCTHHSFKVTLSDDSNDKYDGCELNENIKKKFHRT